MVEALAIVLIVVVLFLFYVLYTLWKSFQEVENLNERCDALNEDIALLDRKNETLQAENTSLRGKITALEIDAAPEEEIIDVTPNPQHFRPMFDSQGALFNEQPSIEQIEELLTPKPTNDLMFYPESFVPVEGENLEEGKVVHGSFFDEEEEEALGYESGQRVGPEPVQDGEETPNGVLRSESVS